MQTNGKKSTTIILVVLGIIILGLVVLLALKNCAKKEYVITFNTNGGSSISAISVLEGEKITKPTDPTKDGYIFAGWYYEDEPFDFNTEVVKDMILEARWVETGRVTGVILDLNKLSLKPNSSHTLVATITPEGAKNQNLKWQSSDESIVTVDKNGKVKALKKGSATITVTTEDGEYSASCTITVTDDIVNVKSVKISGSNEVTVGKTIKLTATITPDDASDKGVTWKSSNTKIATVDKNGNVKGLKSGKVTITVTTTDGGKTDKKEITVKDAQTTPQTPTTPDTGNTDPKPTTPTEVKVSGVKIEGGKDINVGNTVQLTAVVSPTDATNKKVTWKSSNEGIAKVDANGLVTGLDDGTVTITVTTEDGAFTSEVTIKVSSTYRVEFQRQLNNLDKIVSYNIIVYKNNVRTSDYSEVIYKGLSKFDNLLAGEVNEEEKSAVLILKNGTKINVNVQFVN